MYAKATFDVDASIEAEAAKKLPKVKRPPIQSIVTHRPLQTLGKMFEENPEKEIIEETAVEIKPEAVEEKSSLPDKEVFLPPDPANTDLTDLIDALDIVSKYLNGAKNEAIILSDNIHNTELETSDFLHSIELSQFSSDEKIDVFNKVHEIRTRRRSYKYRLEYINELDTFINNNQNITNKINTLRGQLKRIQEKQFTARYYSRIRNDIKEDGRVHIGNRLST